VVGENYKLLIEVVFVQKLQITSRSPPPYSGVAPSTFGGGSQATGIHSSKQYFFKKTKIYIYIQSDTCNVFIGINVATFADSVKFVDGKQL
jgi:hypothetical protein